MSIIDSEQNWQSYRTLINGNVSFCTVNLDIVERFSPDSYNKIVQVSMPYESDEKGMPTLEVHERITLDLFRLLVQSSSLSEVIYAGHISGDGHLQVYYYCDDSEPLFDMLSQFKDCVDKIDVQDDPQWDTYFDFLLPSPLEMKLNATEEIIDMLVQHRRNLADNYTIEHTFQFPEENMMFQFMEEVNLGDTSFNTMSYSNTPVTITNEDDSKESFYIVKIEQELTLDTEDIFNYVEQFENLAEKFSGEYNGWESDTINRVKAN